MTKIMGMLALISPLFAFSQDTGFVGVWQLKEKKSISGPEYSNGVPRGLRFNTNGKDFTMEFVSTLNDKDTIERQTISSGITTNETITAANRKKIVTITWQGSKELTRTSWLSARNDFSKPEIKIVETMTLSPSGNEMEFVRVYDGFDSTNQDFKMYAVFEKTTEEDIALWTAKGKGIRFVKGLTWNKVLERAKKEKKLIFVDCYATWCVPCRKMDMEVYDLNKVGEVTNEKFISIKVQMDTSKKDDSNVKLTYPIARYLEKQFDISVLPTFLFLNADGTILHKGKGSLSAKDFAKLVHDAADPNQQFFTLVRKAREGNMSHPEMQELAKKLDEAGEKELANEIARHYFELYLFKQDYSQVFTNENLDFLNQFKAAFKYSDKLFEYIRMNPSKVDASFGASGNGFSISVIQTVIYAEEIKPNLLKADNTGELPSWDVMHSNIVRRYGKDYADQMLINIKVFWFAQKKMWKAYLENLVLQIEMMGDLTKIDWLVLNGAAWNVFEQSNDQGQLEKALNWSDYAIQNLLRDSATTNKPLGTVLDTYANILYKLGRKEEAIKFYQEKIIVGTLQTISIYETYIKMMRGLPTWNKQ